MDALLEGDGRSSALLSGDHRIQHLAQGRLAAEGAVAPAFIQPGHLLVGERNA